jgi:hypothetical protein
MRKPRERKPRTVQYVKNSLKFKANEGEDVVSIQLGRKKYVVPVKVRFLSTDGYLFLSFPASANLFQVAEDGLVPVTTDEAAQEAFEKLRSRKARGKKAVEQVSMPSELASALAAIPSGFKLGYGADGTPRLVKTRTRAKK